MTVGWVCGAWNMRVVCSTGFGRLSGRCRLWRIGWETGHASWLHRQLSVLHAANVVNANDGGIEQGDVPALETRPLFPSRVSGLWRRFIMSNSAVPDHHPGLFIVGGRAVQHRQQSYCFGCVSLCFKFVVMQGKANFVTADEMTDMEKKAMKLAQKDERKKAKTAGIPFVPKQNVRKRRG